MPISINEFIYHLKQRIAPGRRFAIEELSQADIRELARIKLELQLEQEKLRLQLLTHRRFIL